MARMGRRTSAHGQKSDNPTHEYKSFVFQLEDANEESGEFSGYAAVFGNVDSGRDVIERGAFSQNPSGRILTASRFYRSTMTATCQSANRSNCVKMKKVSISGAKSATRREGGTSRRCSKMAS